MGALTEARTTPSRRAHGSISYPGLAPDEQLVRKAGIQVRVVADGTRKVPAMDELVVNGQPHQCGPGELTPRQRHCLLQRISGSKRSERALMAWS